MRALVIGDVIGKPGRRALDSLLPFLRSEFRVDLVVANGENTAGGLGITAETAHELLDAGVDVITTGNHVWAQREVVSLLESGLPVLRPLNYPPTAPGRGYCITGNAMVVNLMGRVFVGCFDCPFRAADQLLSTLDDRPKVVIVDFHAEATSEKVAMGRYLDGRVSGVLGTHTHVGTVDAVILPHGTAYVTDIGMVGPVDSVIGDNPESVIRHFLTGTPHHISVGKGRVGFDAMLVEVDDSTGKATSIKRLREEVQ